VFIWGVNSSTCQAYRAEADFQQHHLVLFASRKIQQRITRICISDLTCGKDACDCNLGLDLLKRSMQMVPPTSSSALAFSTKLSCLQYLVAPVLAQQ